MIHRTCPPRAEADGDEKAEPATPGLARQSTTWARQSHRADGTRDSSVSTGRTLLRLLPPHRGQYASGQPLSSNPPGADWRLCRGRSVLPCLVSLAGCPNRASPAALTALRSAGPVVA